MSGNFENSYHIITFSLEVYLTGFFKLKAVLSVKLLHVTLTAHKEEKHSVRLGIYVFLSLYRTATEIINLFFCCCLINQH